MAIASSAPPTAWCVVTVGWRRRRFILCRGFVAVFGGRRSQWQRGLDKDGA
jgi:hypothetical protein